MPEGDFLIAVGSEAEFANIFGPVIELVLETSTVIAYVESLSAATAVTAVGCSL